ncbi:hypothetical protein D3C81_1938260 [compost metagenome]
MLHVVGDLFHHIRSMGVLRVPVRFQHSGAKGAAVVQHIHFDQLIIDGGIAVLLCIPLGIPVNPGAFRNMADGIIENSPFFQQSARLHQPVQRNPQRIIPLGEQPIVQIRPHPSVGQVQPPEE